MNWKSETANEYEDVLSLFDTADAELSTGAIPPGKYKALLVAGHLDKARTGTVCFCCKWELVDGEFKGRHLISRHWMTPKSVARTKGDLLELGIEGAHLRGACALPAVTAEISVIHRADDAGDLYQEIKRIRKIGDGTSVNGVQTTNAAGADTTQGSEAGAVHGAGASLPGDDAMVASGDDDESYLDTEFIDFGGKDS